MAEYIDREAAIAHIKSHQCRRCSDIGSCGGCAVLRAIRLFEEVPAADVMEVTRCKDCEHSFKDPVGLCCSYGACKDCLVPEYYFCFHGEKRMNGNDKT